MYCTLYNKSMSLSENCVLAISQSHHCTYIAYYYAFCCYFTCIQVGTTNGHGCTGTKKKVAYCVFTVEISTCWDDKHYQKEKTQTIDIAYSIFSAV